MREFQLPYLLVVMATILFTLSTISDENTIKDLELQSSFNKIIILTV